MTNKRHKPLLQLQIDQNFRPSTYWDEEKRELANISGTVRRTAASAHKAHGRGRFPQNLTRKTTPEEKSWLGWLNPALRSGEDLPPVRRGETEIARIYLPTTVHAEVTSVRARRLKTGRIQYSIADEIYYYDGLLYRTKPRCSDVPLTLAELVELIQTAELVNPPDKKVVSTGLVEPLWEQQHGYGESREQVQRFVHVSSEFYPQLGDAFREKFDQWALIRTWPEDHDDEAGEDNTLREVIQ
jgi:hypothetical protein